MNMNQTASELWSSHDASWWLGQVIALSIAIGLLRAGYGGAVAGAVGYAIAVLVDIREAVTRSKTNRERKE
jgi:hypothetical protein